VSSVLSHLASASIGQIHRATLKSGAEVVIKVQRQGINKVIASDVVVLRMLASMMEALNTPTIRRLTLSCRHQLFHAVINSRP
jgi:predicted unusual protein kinase regulating ubiquinone biosynthesis (AarF/ABC1/UbiB family)